MPHQLVPDNYRAIFFSWYSVTGGRVELAKSIHLDSHDVDLSDNPLESLPTSQLSMAAHGRLSLTLFASTLQTKNQGKTLAGLKSELSVYLKSLSGSDQDQGSKLLAPLGNSSVESELLIEANWEPKKIDSPTSDDLQSSSTSSAEKMHKSILTEDILVTLDTEEFSSRILTNIASRALHQCQFNGKREQAEMLSALVRVAGREALDLHLQTLTSEEIAFYRDAFLKIEKKQHSALGARDSQLAEFLSQSIQGAGAEVRKLLLKSLPRDLRAEFEGSLERAKLQDYKELIFGIAGEEAPDGLNQWLAEKHQKQDIENSQKAFCVNALQYYLSEFGMVLIDTRNNEECTITTGPTPKSVRFILQAPGGKATPWKKVNFPPIQAINKKN